MATLRPRNVDERYLHSELTDRIIKCFYDGYDDIGFGFLESHCTKALGILLAENGLNVVREVPAEIQFRGASLGSIRMDLVVNDLVVVEVKSTKTIGTAEERQLLNYLRATKYEVGLLL